jgi:hypothetical protein
MVQAARNILGTAISKNQTILINKGNFVNVLKDPEIIPRGFYSVGDQQFRTKVQALIHSSKTEQTITWNFHDDLFARFNWSQEPDRDISYYYTLRCHQIRDEYQYLVLHYSGGSDSHNILTHFYRAGIHVDQINVTVPVEYYEKHTRANDSKEAKDLHNEWYHVIKPDLEWIRLNMPDTKITVYDYTNDMLEFKVDQDWIIYSGEHCNPNVVAWIKNYDVVDSKIYDSKKVGHIYGIDKPRVFLHDGQWYFAFLDSILAIMSNYRPAWLKHDYTNIVNFYWSPRLPELLIKQAHLVKKYYEQNSQFLDLATFKALTKHQFEMQQNLIKTAVYPFWRPEIFQVDKARNTFFKEFDQWFHELASESAKGRWNEGYQYLLQNVPLDWFNTDEQGRLSGFMGIWSKWHNLGPKI